MKTISIPILLPASFYMKNYKVAVVVTKIVQKENKTVSQISSDKAFVTTTRA